MKKLLFNVIVLLFSTILFAQSKIIYQQDFESAVAGTDLLGNVQVKNFNAAGGAAWTYDMATGAAAISGSKSSHLTIQNPGTDWWNLQYKVEDAPLTTVSQGMRYNITFKIKSSTSNNKFQFYVQGQSSFAKDITVTTANVTQVVSINTTPMDGSGVANFLWAYGKNANLGDIWIDDIVITEIVEGYSENFEDATVGAITLGNADAINYGGGAAWTFGLETGSAIAGLKSGYFNITNTGTDWWTLQYRIDSKFAVKAGVQYKVTFKIKSSVANTMRFYAQVNADFSQDVPLVGGNAVENFSIITAPMDRSAANTVFIMAFGKPGVPAQIRIDDILITEVLSTPTVTPTIGSYTYTGSAQGPNTATNTGTGTSYTYSYVNSGGTTYGPSDIPPINAGNYTVTATVYSNGSYYLASSAATPFSIGVATPTVTPTIGTYTYSGAAQGPNTVTGNTGLGTVNWSYVGTGSTSYAASSTRPTNAGTYTATATVAANGNYGSASSAATAFSIGVATPTVTVITGTYTYSGVQKGPNTVTGNMGGGTVTWSYVGTGNTIYAASSTRPTNAGTYTATATVGAKGNYGSASSSATAFSIGVTPSVTPTIGTYTYTGSAQGPNTATNTGTGTNYTYSYVNSGGTAYGPSATAPTNAGNYTVTATVAANGNYGAASSSATAFTILRATPTATLAVSNSPVAYTALGQSATVGISASSVAGTVSGILTGGAATQTAAGTYAVTASYVPTDSANYNTLTGLSAGNFVISSSTTWNGTVWNLGTPTVVLNAVINAAYTTGSFTAKSLTVNATGSLTIATGTSVTVAESLTNNNGTITVQNNANLFQTGAIDTNAGTGSVTVNRDSNSLKRLDYTLWSTPIKTGNRTFASFSPYTFTSRNYIYNPGTNFYNSVANTSTFSAGTGYLVRMPDVLPSNPIYSNTYYAGTANLVFNGVFTGTSLNNGPITINTTANSYNGVGNPYPSTISANDFLSGNATSGTLYFWRKTNNLNQALAATTSYASYTFEFGGVANGGFTPSETIQVGQGFIVKATGSTLVFNNTMRKGIASATFLKTKVQAEKSRIWLNLKNEGVMLNQTLVGYMDGATLGVDLGIDGKSFGDGAIELSSDIDGEGYTIQGRPAFDTTDVVTLNFKTSIAGTYTIAIDHVDGLFSKGQDIYLIDKTTGITTNLNDGAYTFTTNVGVDNTRFTLTYQKTLKADVPLFNESSVLVSRNNGTVNVKSSAVAINNIKVYDLQGRLVAERKNVKSNAATISNLKANQVLIVKVTSDNNAIVTKKVFN